MSTKRDDAALRVTREGLFVGAVVGKNEYSPVEGGFVNGIRTNLVGVLVVGVSVLPGSADGAAVARGGRNSGRPLPGTFDSVSSKQGQSSW